MKWALSRWYFSNRQTIYIGLSYHHHLDIHMKQRENMEAQRQEHWKLLNYSCSPKGKYTIWSYTDFFRRG